MEDNQVGNEIAAASNEVEVSVDLEPEATIDNPAAVLEALKKANAEAKQRREDYQALQKEFNELKTNSGGDKFKDRAKRAEVKLALQEKGVKNVNGILKHLSLGEIDYDSEGELIGLESTLAALKEDLPQLFSAKARAGEIEQFAEGVSKKKLTASEIQAAEVLKGW